MDPRLEAAKLCYLLNKKTSCIELTGRKMFSLQDQLVSPMATPLLHCQSLFLMDLGTGKSVLLRAIIKKLRPNPLVVNGIAVTASTGIAGLNIGGTTLHSFAGIGLGKERAEVLARKIKKSTKLSQRWRTTRVLIIDESQLPLFIHFADVEYI
jgi:hypothetical protein